MLVLPVLAVWHDPVVHQHEGVATSLTLSPERSAVDASADMLLLILLLVQLVGGSGARIGALR